MPVYSIAIEFFNEALNLVINHHWQSFTSQNHHSAYNTCIIEMRSEDFKAEIAKFSKSFKLLKVILKMCGDTRQENLEVAYWEIAFSREHNRDASAVIYKTPRFVDLPDPFKYSIGSENGILEIRATSHTGYVSMIDIVEWIPGITIEDYDEDNFAIQVVDTIGHGDELTKIIIDHRLTQRF